MRHRFRQLAGYPACATVQTGVPNPSAARSSARQAVWTAPTGPRLSVATAGSERSGYRYLVVAVLALVYSLNFLDRQLLSILAEPVKADLGLSDTQLGLLTGFMFAIFYTAFGIPVAFLADRYRRVWIVSGACALWSLFSAACGLAQSFTQLALARMGVGIGEAGGSPPSYSIIADYFPPGRRAMAAAMLSASRTASRWHEQFLVRAPHPAPRARLCLQPAHGSAPAPTGGAAGAG